MPVSTEQRNHCPIIPPLSRTIGTFEINIQKMLHSLLRNGMNYAKFQLKTKQKLRATSERTCSVKFFWLDSLSTVFGQHELLKTEKSATCPLKIYFLQFFSQVSQRPKNFGQFSLETLRHCATSSREKCTDTHPRLVHTGVKVATFRKMSRKVRRKRKKIGQNFAGKNTSFRQNIKRPDFCCIVG